MAEPTAQTVPFRNGSRENYLAQPVAQTFTAFSQKLTWQLTQTGFLADISLHVTGAVTGTGSPSGSWPTYPPLPWALFKQIRLWASNGIEIVNISGWGLYLYNMRRRRISPQGVDLVSYLNTNNKALILAAPSGSVSGGSNTITAYMRVPVVTDEMTQYGLLNTQTNELRLYLDITLGSQTDIFGAATYATTGPFVSFTVTPNTRTFSVPDSLSGVGMPNQSYVQYLQEEPVVQTLGTGDWVARPAPGNVFLGYYGILENNGAQVAPSAITQVGYKFAITNQPKLETYPIHVGRLKELYGYAVPDGFVDFAFDAGSGSPGSTIVDSRDWLNTSNLTDLQFIATVTGLTPAGTTQWRTIKQMLGQL